MPTLEELGGRKEKIQPDPRWHGRVDLLLLEISRLKDEIALLKGELGMRRD